MGVVRSICVVYVVKICAAVFWVAGLFQITPFDFDMLNPHRV